MPYETYEALDNASKLLKMLSDALKDDGKISISEGIEILRVVGLEVYDDVRDDEDPEDPE